MFEVVGEVDPEHVFFLDVVGGGVEVAASSGDALFVGREHSQAYVLPLYGGGELAFPKLLFQG